MAFIYVIALALALASPAWSSHPSGSAGDQYEARENRPRPQLLTEATDHRPEVHMSHQPNFIKKSTNNKLPTPDLQVGCGDGFIQEKLRHNSETDKNEIQLSTKTLLKSRRKRSYYPASGQISYAVPYQSISVWRPPVYQLSRPYYIPIFGIPGRVPIYYPPQPFYMNPGVPTHNPTKKPFTGPTYLPPDPKPTKMPTPPRFGDDDDFDNDKDRPIWDVVGENQKPTQRPFSTTTSVMPTRMTRPPGAPNKPSLVHTPTDPLGFEEVVQNELSTPAPSTTRPPPLQAPARPNEPSRCVWAIISCCSTSNQISYECFEQRGCPGAFWDNSPCDNDFARAAIAAALNYYNK